MANNHDDEIWFGPDNLGDGVDRYVAWLDVMGTSANTYAFDILQEMNIVKFQTAVESSEHVSDSYNMMDGAFVLAENREDIENLIDEIYTNAATAMVDRWNDSDDDFDSNLAYMVRGVVTHGEVYPGRKFEEDCFLADSEAAENILVGEPVVTAVEFETNTPPFGVTFHESASDDDSNDNWEWWDNNTLAADLREMLNEYLDYCSSQRRIQYKDSKIERHRDLINNYFPDHPLSSSGK